jgi:hypothetical protein
MLTNRRISLYQQIRRWKLRSPLKLNDHNSSEEQGDGGNDDDDDDDDDEAFTEVEHSLLPLPSNSTPINNERLALYLTIEKELRAGQSRDALKQLRKTLALKLALLRGSKLARGQRDNLRSQAAIKRVTEEVRGIVSRYRASYSALVRLGLGEGKSDLQVLNDSDLSTANVFEENRRLGRGFDIRDVSWIWRMPNIGLEAQDNNWLSEGAQRMR